MLNVTASWVHFLLQGSVPWACARIKNLPDFGNETVAADASHCNAGQLV
uniref:Uncharacterized protein n=1 Tax=Anguilla anguilla TaxID=7936 RepID=A0A0E9S3H7_ANGAN